MRWSSLVGGGAKRTRFAIYGRAEDGAALLVMGFGTRMEPAEVQRLAKKDLGNLRYGVRAELRGLPLLLEDSEQLLCLALGSLGALPRGRLVAATDRRLILTHKYTLRPQHVEAIPYERFDSINAEPGKLTTTVGDRKLRLDVLPWDRGPELANIIAARTSAREVAVRDKRPLTRGLLGGLVALLLGYVAGGLLGLGAGEELQVGNCTDVRFNRISCKHPDARFELVRQVESAEECRKRVVTEEGPTRYPWVGDETFCARRLATETERRG